MRNKPVGANKGNTGNAVVWVQYPIVMSRECKLETQINEQQY